MADADPTASSPPTAAAPTTRPLHSPHGWTISTYFAEGFPYSVVNNLADLFFTEHKATLQHLRIRFGFNLAYFVV